MDLAAAWKDVWLYVNATVPWIAITLSAYTLWRSVLRDREQLSRELIKLWTTAVQTNSQITRDALRAAWLLVWIRDNDSERFDDDRSLRLRIDHVKALEDELFDRPDQSDEALAQAGEMFTKVSVIELQDTVSAVKMIHDELRHDLTLIEETRALMTQRA